MTHEKEIKELIELLNKKDQYIVWQGEPCHKAIKAMCEENLRLKAENEWLPIETAPKDGTEIIITDGYDVHTGKFRKSNVINNSPYFCKSCDGRVLNDGYDWENIPIYMHEPTHWKPLPTPPQENE